MRAKPPSAATRSEIVAQYHRCNIRAQPERDEPTNLGEDQLDGASVIDISWYVTSDLAHRASMIQHDACRQAIGCGTEEQKMAPETGLAHSMKTRSTGHFQERTKGGSSKRSTAKPKLCASQEAATFSSVYLQLKDLVINSRFRPGEQLYPSTLSQHLRVSSTPVREALHRLAAEQLVLATPNRGFFSRVPTIEETIDLHKLLNALTKYAVESAPESTGSWLKANGDLLRLFNSRAPASADCDLVRECYLSQHGGQPE
jgi:hypothetical protein